MDAQDRDDAAQWKRELETLPLHQLLLTSRGEAVQAWMYEKKTADGTYLCFFANGEAEKLPLDEVERRAQEATAIQEQQGPVYPFIPELVPSLIAFFAKYPREHPIGPPYTHWRQLFHFHSREAWLTIRCRDCRNLRHVALRFLTIINQRQYEGVWRRCEMLYGAECGQTDTEQIYPVDMKRMFEAVQARAHRAVVVEPPLTQKMDNDHEFGDPMSEEERTSTCGEAGPHSVALIEMWKSLGKSLKQPAYAGEGNPNQLRAWKDDVEMFLQVYNVRGESQVLAASKFLQGEADEWWKSLQATGRHRHIQSLEQLCQELKKRFFPLDRLERLAKQWVTLEQRGGIQEYRDDFCLLQAAYPLGERVEFMLAYQGLKPRMRVEIRQALDEGGVDQLPLERLFTLARKAEIRDFQSEDDVQLIAVKGAEPKWKKTTGRALKGYQEPPKVTRHVETYPKKTAEKTTANRAGMLREYPYWVCDRTGHLIRDCPEAKKQGCYHCGESHTVRECPKRLAKIRVLQGCNSSATEKGELSYTVQARGRNVKVLIDTGAQCSLIRDDVAKRLRLRVREIKAKERPELCGVNGNPLNVKGQAELVCQQAGQTVSEAVWVVQGIQNEVILGLPWLRCYQPNIRWRERTLEFPTGKVWEPELESHIRLKTVNCI